MKLYKKFTLMELLVIIAIIGILVSTLLPSLSKVQTKGRQAVCMSNISQVSQAVMLYATRNNMFGPKDTDNSNGQRWFDKMQPKYLPDGDITYGSFPTLRCPEAREPERSWESPISINYNVSGSLNRAQTRITLATQSETCLLMDSFSSWRRIDESRMTVDRVLNNDQNKRVARHMDQANVGLIDGSVKSYTATQLLQFNSSMDTFWDVSQ